MIIEDIVTRVGICICIIFDVARAETEMFAWYSSSKFEAIYLAYSLTLICLRFFEGERNWTINILVNL